MNHYDFTYPCPWEIPIWERKTCDPVRRAYVAWLKRYPWNLFVTVNFRQKQVYLKKENHHETEMYLKNVTSAPWGSSSDVESRLKVMDGRVCKELLGRHWASKIRERPEWAGFIEKDEEGFAHAHLLVNLKEIDRKRFIIAFTNATKYFAPQADIRPQEGFKDIYLAEGAIFYSTKFHNNPYKECALTVSPTFLKRTQHKQGTASFG
jgi:hypothetical protein